VYLNHFTIEECRIILILNI